MEKDWVTVYKSRQSRYAIELKKHHLDVAGIESVILDKSDSYAYIGLFKEEIPKELKVRREDEKKALEILKENNAE